jgi:transcription initiation factor TFIIIB Brf1 subunit/transcription initiation factor TFIIB
MTAEVAHIERVCHFCGLVIEDDEKVIEAKTRNGWAHVTCWYDGGPFERKMRGLLRRREDRRS